MDELKLIEKLLRIEALYAGATTDGERVAADRARERIRERLNEMRGSDPPVEMQFSMSDMWSRKVFVALCRRYELKPYRYFRQRYTTVMLKVPRRFLDETLWPEFKEITAELNFFLGQVTDRVIRQVLDQESGEAEVVKELAAPSSAVEPAKEEPAPPDKPDKTETKVPEPAASQRKNNRKKKKKKRRR